jgi:two-component system alkaline phosphatase synthesis response regulator PhoP
MSVNNSFSIVFVDNAINRLLKTLDALKNEYPGVIAFNNEQEATEHLILKSADVVFINLDLSPNDAVTFTKELKQTALASDPFIIIYSDKQDDFVQELAFNSGVDGFINFHYKPAVMLLFLKNLLKRKQVKEILPTEDIIIDEDRYMVVKDGNSIHLPRKEFKVFQLLFYAPEKFFTKNEIATLIWKDEAVSNKRIIDVHIYNIRQLFGKRIIQSQKGKGYRINKKLIATD